MLGEEGVWGHVYYLYPPVIQVPLIVHLPTAASQREHSYRLNQAYRVSER